MIYSYVCSKNVVDYVHFGSVQSGKCPLHENVEDRHQQEVKKAADEAMTKVRAENPNLSDADLMVKVSDQVKQVEDARRGRVAADANAFPYHMVDDVLARRDFQPRGEPQVHPPRPPPVGMQPFAPYMHNLPAAAPAPVNFQPVNRGIFIPGAHRGPVPQQWPQQYVNNYHQLLHQQQQQHLYLTNLNRQMQAELMFNMAPGNVPNMGRFPAQPPPPGAFYPAVQHNREQARAGARRRHERPRYHIPHPVEPEHERTSHNANRNGHAGRHG